MAILVTGGAGYVGSIVAYELIKQGYHVVILDNLCQGHREAVPQGAEFYYGDICQPECLDFVFSKHKVEAVMHMAAETIVSRSVTDPASYFRNNVCGGMNLLEAMLRHDVTKIIFSSSAAVYGEPEEVPIPEDHPTRPLNSYGESKLMFERILDWFGRAYGIRHISLRYFNASGAADDLGEDHRPETHLIPNVLRAALEDRPVPIYGTDYPTPDGSCLRDYVHVIDIAQAHILALERLNELSGRVYNLGNSKGYSVLEVIAAAERVTGKEIQIDVQPRRPGDPAVLIASAERAREELGWKPQFSTIEEIIETAWSWLRRHPKGYSR